MISWTPEMVEFLREMFPDSTVAEVREMLWYRFGVLADESKIVSARKRYGISMGRDGRFEPGNCPANKGRKRSEWMSEDGIERCRQTQFSLGHEPEQGRAFPVGAERVDKDGYVEVKVSRLSGESRKCWRPKHRIIWESAHGPVPPGCVVVFADGDKRNFALENLVCISRADAAQISKRGLEYHDAESLQIALDIVHLGRAVYEKECRERSCQRCGQTFKPRFPLQRTCDECLGRAPESSTRKPPESPLTAETDEKAIDAHLNEKTA